MRHHLSVQRLIHGVQVLGLDVEPQTQCAHYCSPQDVVALKFPCCGIYYPCYECHAAIADHKAAVWPKGLFSTPAILCGACGHELTITEYLGCHFSCPACDAAFNPGCVAHYQLYFEE